MAVTLTALYKLPNLATQDATVGSFDWAYLNNIKIDHGGSGDYGSAVSFSSTDWHDLVKAHLVIDSVIQTGINKASSNPRVDTNPNLVLGGTADLWSASLTAAQVVSEEFGIALSYGDEGAMGVPETKYLIARDFQFNIPLTSTILGVQTKIDHRWYGTGGGGSAAVAVDDVQTQITFSWAPEAKTEGNGGGYIYIEDTGQPKQQKKIRYFIFDADDNYVREWRDVTTNLSLRTEVNKALYNIDLDLARNPFEEQSDITPWELEEGGDFFTDEEFDLILSLDSSASIGLGPGTDLQENNNVKVKAFYGENENLLWEDGTVALTEDYRPFYIENDAIDKGYDIYSGFIQDWEANLGGNDTVGVYLMNDAEELNNIMLETDETIIIDNSAAIGEIGIAGVGWDDYYELAQTFTMTGGTTKVSRIGIMAKGGFENYPVYFTASLYEGSNPTSPGTLLATQKILVSNYVDYEEINFTFPNAITLTNGQPYILILTNDWLSPVGGGRYPVYFQTNTAYSGGIGYAKVASVGVFYNMSADICFKLWEAGLDTTVVFNSVDPSDIARSAIDFARSQGAKINYTAESIEDTGTEVSITFQTNTIAEVLEKVVELCPEGWYWTYDPGSNLYSLKPLSVTLRRKFTNKGDVINLRLRKSLTKLINQVYFSGGGEPALFRKTTDVNSRNQHRKALVKLSDSRVTDDDTAAILSQAQIDRFKEPVYIATVIIGAQHPEAIENIELGEKIGFLNYGNFIDNLELQISAATYNLDTVALDLGVILPRVTKRIEDIKRNLDIEQQKNNPVVPDE